MVSIFFPIFFFRSLFLKRTWPFRRQMFEHPFWPRDQLMSAGIYHKKWQLFVQMMLQMIPIDPCVAYFPTFGWF